MAGKKKEKITVSGNTPRPGQTGARTIVLTQPKRFGIDISDYTTSVHAAENVDYSRRYKLYDLYSDILMDTHLSSVIDKRVRAVLSSNIEFKRNGKPDKAINEQLRSAWFRRCVEDILAAQWWGFSLMQFYKKKEWIDYDLIPRKHADPVRRLILRHQTDITGTSWDEYADLLFVGDAENLGLLAKAAPWVIYKRNTIADLAQFSEVYGAPIQEYIYETDDDEARQRAIDDATNAGNLAVFIHAKDTELQLKEAGNKSGSADLYERFCERCNNELSKLFLGNTLTTESSDKGTQALGTVHKKVEDKVTQADRRYVLDVLNYNLTDIFMSMGINTEGGEFFYPEPKDIDLTAKMNILSQLKKTFDLPVSDDYLYEEFGVEKPKNYNELKAESEKKKQEVQLQPTAAKEELEDEPEEDPNKQPEPTPKQKKNFANWLSGFFDRAPKDNDGALGW